MKFNIFFLVLLFFGNELGAQTTVQIRPMYGGKELNLLDPFYSTTGDTLNFSTLRFYVSNLVIQDDQGKELTTESCHLIDLEEPERLVLISSQAKISTLSFLLGTDSLTNVSGILDGPLDPINGMYWTWNSGYINFKLEGTSSQLRTPKKQFEFHLGGYLSPFPTSRAFDIQLDGNAKTIYIDIDIEKWLNSVDLNQNSMVMIPGNLAYILSDKLQQCISISYAN